MLSVLLIIGLIPMLLLQSVNAEIAQEQQSPENNSVTTEMANEEAFCVEIRLEAARLKEVMYALCKEYEKFLIVKYADLNLTLEARNQQIRENQFSTNKVERRTAKELSDYGMALRYATNTVQAMTRIMITPDTEEFDELCRTIREMESAVAMGRDATVDVRDGEIRIAPSTAEYRNLQLELVRLFRKPELTDEESEMIRQIISEIKEMAKTNTPTSVFQMPKTE